MVAEDDALGEIVAKLILCKATDRMKERGVSPLAGARALAFAAVAMCRSAGAEERELVATATRRVGEVLGAIKDEEGDEGARRPSPGRRRSLPQRRAAAR
jgi:hypothetical protein